MPDKWLCGNGEMCPACQLRRQAAGPWDWPRLSCNGCDGLGRIAYSPERIVADTLAEARAHNERSAA